MPKPPARLLALLVLAALCLCATPGFCVQVQLTEFQQQARDYRSQGYELQKQGEFEQALGFYQKAIYLDPEYVLPYNDAGIAYEMLGQPELAREMYLKAIEIAPRYPETYSNLALLCEGQEDYVNAVLNWMKRAMFGGVNDPWAETARKRLEQIARLHPDAYGKVGKEYKEEIESFNRKLLPEPDMGEGTDLGATQGPWPAGPSKVSLQSLDMPRRQYSSSSSKGKKKTEVDELPQLDWKAEEASLAVSPATTDAGTAFQDNKARALNYLASAREYFARGEYVAALREATVAEYLDSSNKEISLFVEKVRKTLLQ